LHLTVTTVNSRPNTEGFAYQHGWTDQPADLTSAAIWYDAAAGNGHAEAALNLGVMYAEGAGVAQNDQSAAEQLHRAADAVGASMSCKARADFNLGVMCVVPLL
jgi:TPR repeat protein